MVFFVTIQIGVQLSQRCGRQTENCCSAMPFITSAGEFLTNGSLLVQKSRGDIQHQVPCSQCMSMSIFSILFYIYNISIYNVLYLVLSEDQVLEKLMLNHESSLSQHKHGHFQTDPFAHRATNHCSKGGSLDRTRTQWRLVSGIVEWVEALGSGGKQWECGQSHALNNPMEKPAVYR